MKRCTGGINTNMFSPTIDQEKNKTGRGEKQLQLICHSMHCSGSSGEMLRDNSERGINWICRDKSSSFASRAQERPIMSNIVSIIETFIQPLLPVWQQPVFLRHDPKREPSTDREQTDDSTLHSQQTCLQFTEDDVYPFTANLFFSIILYKTNT